MESLDWQKDVGPQLLLLGGKDLLETVIASMVPCLPSDADGDRAGS